MFFFGLVSTIAAGFDGKNGIDSGRVSGRARRPQRLQKVGARLRAGLRRQRRRRRFFRPGTSTAKKKFKTSKIEAVSNRFHRGRFDPHRISMWFSFC